MAICSARSTRSRSRSCTSTTRRQPIGDDLVHESRFRRTPPGAGTFALGEFAEALDAIGYDGVVSIEVLSAALRRRPPAEGARELLDSLEALRSVRHVRVEMN